MEQHACFHRDLEKELGLMGLPLGCSPVPGPGIVPVHPARPRFGLRPPVVVGIIAAFFALTLPFHDAESKRVNKQGEAAKPEPVTVSVLLSDDVEGKGLQDGAEEFFRRTGVRVRYTAVEWRDMAYLQAMSLAAGAQAYDAVVSDARMVAEHARGGRYAALDGGATFGEARTGAGPGGGPGPYVRGVLELASVDGRLFGVPLAASWTVAFVNTRILRDAGIDPGRRPATWSDIVKTGRLLKSRSVYALTDSLKPGESTTTAFFRWAGSAGARVWEKREGRVYWTLDSRECLEAVLFLKRLLYEGIMDPGVAVRAEEDCLGYFMTGGAAMLPGRDVWYRSLKGGTSPGVRTPAPGGPVPGSNDVAAVPFPGSRRGLCGSTERHRFLSIPSSARNGERARSFLRFIASREESRRRAIVDGMSPVFRDLYDDPETRKSVPADAILASADRCVEMPAIPQFGEISELISDTLQDILVNGRDPAAALSEAARAANRLCGW